MTSRVASQGFTDYSSGPKTITLVGTGTDKVVLLMLVGNANDSAALSSVTLDSVAGYEEELIITTLDGEVLVVGIYSWNNANHPGAGAFDFNWTTAGITQISAAVVELQDAPQTTPALTLFLSEVDSALVSGVALNKTVTGQSSDYALSLFACADANFADFTFTESANLSLLHYVDNSYPHLYLLDDASVASASEVHTVTPTLTAGTLPSQYVHGSLVLATPSSSAVIDTEPTDATRGETGIILGASAGGFEASQGTGGVTYGGEACTVTAWSDTSITITVPSTIALQHDATGYVFQVTTDSAATSDSSTIPFLEPAGWDYVDIDYTLVDVASNDSVYYGDTASTLNGAQYVYEAVTSPDSLAITITDEGYVNLPSAPTATQTFDGYVIESDGTIRTTYTFTISITSSVSVSSIIKEIITPLISDIVN